MTDAPDRIWIGASAWFDRQYGNQPGYTRSDIPHLPEELVERMRVVLYGSKIDEFNRDDDGLLSPAGNREPKVVAIIEDILATIDGEQEVGR